MGGKPPMVRIGFWERQLRVRFEQANLHLARKKHPRQVRICLLRPLGAAMLHINTSHLNEDKLRKTVK